MKKKASNCDSIWDYLALIKRRINEIYNEALKEKSEALLIEKFSSFIKDSEILNEYIYDDLGVFGGAFAVSDNETKQVLLLETSRFTRGFFTGEKIIIDIPYRDLNESADFIDTLFIEKRSSQKLQKDNTGTINLEEFNLPEFIFNLPSFRGNRRDGDRSEILKLKFEDKLVDELFCPEGEVLFFLYAWRWLLRYTQQVGQEKWGNSINFKSVYKAKIESEKDNEEKSQDVEIWWRDFAGFSKGEELPEWKLLELINEQEEEYYKEPKEEIKDFLGNVRDKWKKIKQYENDKDFSDDLENLGLKNKLVLLKLVSYALHISERLKLDNKVIAALRRAALTLKHSENEEVSCLQLEKHLFDTICGLLVTSAGNEFDFLKKPALDCFSLILQLHNFARFPILPYFYMNSILDRDFVPMEHRRIKEHFVFPVYNSYEYAAKIEETHVPEVVFCLLSLKPHAGLIDEIYTNGYPEDSFWCRLNEIKQVFTLLALPVIDKIFLGTLVAEKVAKEAADKAIVEARQEQLEMAINKERSIAHVSKSLHSRLNAYLKEDDHKTKIIVKIIAKFFSYSYLWRQYFSYDASQQKKEDYYYIDFFDFWESLVVQLLCVYYPETRFKIDTPLLDRINDYYEEYFETFENETTTIKESDYYKMVYPREDRTKFLEDLNFLKIQYDKKSELSVKINVSKNKVFFFPLLVTFTEIITNIILHAGTKAYCFLKFRKINDSYYIIFSNWKMEEPLDEKLLMKYQSVEKFLGDKKSFGLRSIDVYLNKQNCEFRVYKSDKKEEIKFGSNCANQFSSFIKVNSPNSLFLFEEKR